MSEDEPLPAGVVVGRGTYGHNANTFRIFIHGARIEVGSFCSIGPEVRILAGSEHITDRASSYPLNALVFNPGTDNSEDAFDKGTTVVGGDAWIGLGAIILSGVLVGEGAVIGAGAVVSKHVPPYAVVAGNPAAIIGYRFDAQTRRRLQAVQWWEWDEEDIRALHTEFMGDIDTFLAEAERRHESRQLSRLARRIESSSPDMLTPPRMPSATAGDADPDFAKVQGLERQIAAMRGTTAWRWATRYWRLKSRLGLLQRRRAQQ
jgi:acetyltransferase-like isoleucine patch superfamily enzyme